MSENRADLKKILRSKVHTVECCRDEQEEIDAWRRDGLRSRSPGLESRYVR